MKFTRVQPKLGCLRPTLVLEFEQVWYTATTVPVDFSGTASAYGKIVGNIQNGRTTNTFALQPEKPTHESEAGYFVCDIELGREGAQFIHASREEQANRDITINMSILFRALSMVRNGIQTSTISETLTFSIASSVWLETFCPVLGIGDFSTIEIGHASLLSVLTEMKESMQSLLQAANKAFMDGDWIDVIFSSRKFFEHAGKMSSEIDIFAQKQVKSAEYAKNLNGLITASFQIISKYQHTHSRNNEELNLNVARADAQMALYLMMAVAAILNRIEQATP